MNLSDYPIIGDTKSTLPNEGGTGYIPRDYEAYPLGGLKCAKPPKLAPIDPATYKERIAEKTAKKSWASDICDAKGVTVKNQQSTSFCWVNAPTHGVEVIKALQGGTIPKLSPANAGCQINGFRNQGGSGITAVEWINKYGVCTEEFWPANAISGARQYMTEAAKANAALHKILEYDDMDPRDNDAIIASLLHGFPVTVGIPAWGHEVLLTFLVWDGRPYFGFDNSWGTGWGNNGRGILTGSKERFDEAGAIRAITPSNA